MALRLANTAFGLLFAFSVVVQVNDPDGFRWMLVYAAACVACVAWEWKRLPRLLPIGVGSVALVWCAASALGTHLEAPVGEALTDWQMHAGGSEELRETLGLLLVALWMGTLFLFPQRGTAAVGRPPGPQERPSPPERSNTVR